MKVHACGNVLNNQSSRPSQNQNEQETFQISCARGKITCFLKKVTFSFVAAMTTQTHSAVSVVTLQTTININKTYSNL